MNTLQFIAKTAHASEEDGCYTVGFADDEFDHIHFVLLQRASEFDAQDIELGMDGEYIEIDDQANSAYKLVESAIFDRSLFCINLKPNHSGIDRIKIDLTQTDFDEAKMVKLLLEIIPNKIHFL